MEANKILSLSTLLDPRFKKLAFANKDATEKGLRILVSEASSADVNHYDSTTPESTSLSSQPTSSTSSTSSLWQLFDEQVTPTRAATQNLGVSAFTEVQQFIKSPVIPRAECPLKWWKNNSRLYPKLVPSARRYHSAVATSVPAERLFSKAGELISMRSTLKGENVDIILFLNKSFN